MTVIYYFVAGSGGGHVLQIARLWMTEGNFWESVFSVYRVSSRDWTPVNGLGRKTLYLMSHFLGPTC